MILPSITLPEKAHLVNISLDGRLCRPNNDQVLPQGLDLGFQCVYFDTENLSQASLNPC